MSNIVLLHRKKAEGRYSIEKVFKPLEKLPFLTRLEVPCEMNSIYNFIRLIIFSWNIKEKYVHIAGDVHYMSIFLFWKRITITIHDCNHYEELKGFKKYLLGLLWFELPTKIAKEIVVISPYTKTQLIAYFKVPENKIRIIPNAIEYANMKRANEKYRHSRDYRILVVGTKRNKNIQRLVDAISGLLDIELEIIGVLPESIRNYLEKNKISYANSFNLLTKDIISKYRSSDLLYFASTKEGFGLPILEAQANGLPVITSTTTSMPFVAGNGALLVNPYNVSEIKRAIQKVRSDPKTRLHLIEQGSKNLKRFELSNFVNEYKNLFSEVFNSRIE